MRYADKPERAKQLIEIGLKLAEKSSYLDVTRTAVAEAADVAKGTVNYAVGGTTSLRDAIVKLAVEKECLTVVAQALAHKHEIALEAPDHVKAAAAHLIAGL